MRTVQITKYSYEVKQMNDTKLMSHAWCNKLTLIKFKNMEFAEKRQIEFDEAN